MATGPIICPYCGSGGAAGQHSFMPAVPVTARAPVKCPVCLGKGSLHCDFYAQQTGRGTSTMPVECRSCRGRGIV